LALDAILSCIDAVTRFCYDLPDSEAMVWHTCEALICDLAARIATHAGQAAVARSVAARAQLLVDTMSLAAALPALQQRVASAAAAGSVQADVELTRDVAARVAARLLAFGVERVGSSSGSGGGAGSAVDSAALESVALTPSSNTSPALAAADAALHDTAGQLRTLIRQILVSSVDEVLADALSLNWAPSHVNSERSGYATDLLILLEGSIMKIAPLAESLRLDLISGVFAHVSQFLSVMLLLRARFFLCVRIAHHPCRHVHTHTHTHTHSMCCAMKTCVVSICLA
jgi:hypothetical protein